MSNNILVLRPDSLPGHFSSCLEGWSRDWIVRVSLEVRLTGLSENHGVHLAYRPPVSKNFLNTGVKPALHLPKDGWLLWLICGLQRLRSVSSVPGPQLATITGDSAVAIVTKGCLCNPLHGGQLYIYTKLKNVQTLWPSNPMLEIYSEIMEHSCQHVHMWTVLRVV